MTEKISKEEREEILDRVEQKAAAYQYEFKGCGRIVVLALQQEFDLPGGSAVIKAASFTGGGIAHMGNVCAALLGGIMGIGLTSGPQSLEDPIYPEPEVLDEAMGNPKSLELVRRFYQRFVQEFGDSTCRNIQVKMFGKSYNTGIPKEREAFSQVSREKCAELVGKVARLAAEAILEMPRR